MKNSIRSWPGCSERNGVLKAQWQREKELIDAAKKLKERQDALKIEEQNAERRGDLEKVAEIRYGKLIAVSKELESLASRPGRGPEEDEDA